MKKVLVTGGYGYIGSHTIKRLAECGYIVDSLDINSSSNNISPFVRKNMIGDIRTICIGATMMLLSIVLHYLL
jgi:nucleoside-diphosphate-sugar epimerase